MPSPVAHSLIGLSVGQFFEPRAATDWRPWTAYCLVAANAPDLDFLAGWFGGDINAFHHGPSHSLAAAVVFGVLSVIVLHRFWTQRWRLFFGGTAVYASHVVLDMFCGGPDGTGIPLLWPLTNANFVAPWQPFAGILHGVHGDGVGTFLGELFSWYNLRVLAVEFALCFPVFAISYLWRRDRRELALAHSTST